MNKKYIYRLIYSFLLFIVNQFSYAIDLTETIQVHGFLTQGAFYTSENNYSGKSQNNISLNQTEIGLNMTWDANNKIEFFAQALFRRAGELDNSVRLDYGLVNINLFSNTDSSYGMRLGRIKNPIGLYNETRDVAFTTPSILLPQSIYLERSRSLFLSSDGGQLYGNYQLGLGWLSIKLNYGYTQNENDEIQKAIFGSIAQGKLEAGALTFLGQIAYGIDSGKYILAISYVDLELDYSPGSFDPIADGTARFKPFILSAQYNGEKISITSEYYYSRNEFKDFGLYPDASPVTANWYIQGAYRLLQAWQATIRYDNQILDKDDPSGKNFENAGLPAHTGFTKDWMFALRWDINPSMMLRAEYHYINGTSWISSKDNPDRSKTNQHWDLLALQFSYRF